MATIVKCYPPKSNLQLIRYDSNAPFECWRCRKTKVSKLQAIVNLEKPRTICNACYGRLLSLAEIKAKDIEPWLKSEHIHALTLKEVSAKAAAQAAEKQAHRRKQYWKFISPEAQRFIGTAEYLYEYMADRDALDFSPLIIELVKSYEHEIIVGLIEPVKDKVNIVGFLKSEVQIDCLDKDFGRIAQYVFGYKVKPPELGTIGHTLRTLLQNKGRIEESKFLSIFNAHISSCRDSDYFFDEKRCVAQIFKLTQSYRNPSAHVGFMSKQAFEECMIMLMDAGGVLWQLVTAIR